MIKPEPETSPEPEPVTEPATEPPAEDAPLTRAEAVDEPKPAPRKKRQARSR